MPFWLLAGVAVGLSMDALAVAIGVSIKCIIPRPARYSGYPSLRPVSGHDAVAGWATGQYTPPWSNKLTIGWRSACCRLSAAEPYGTLFRKKKSKSVFSKTRRA